MAKAPRVYKCLVCGERRAPARYQFCAVCVDHYVTRETLTGSGRNTSQGFGHNVVAVEKNNGRTIEVRATPPTRFGTLYYINNDSSFAWATIAEALAAGRTQ